LTLNSYHQTFLSPHCKPTTRLQVHSFMSYDGFCRWPLWNLVVLHDDHKMASRVRLLREIYASHFNFWDFPLFKAERDSWADRRTKRNAYCSLVRRGHTLVIEMMLKVRVEPLQWMFADQRHQDEEYWRDWQSRALRRTTDCLYQTTPDNGHGSSWDQLIMFMTTSMSVSSNWQVCAIIVVIIIIIIIIIIIFFFCFLWINYYFYFICILVFSILLKLTYKWHQSYASAL